ncbi:hypothetical protein VB773_03185 [Haloarculaceae archaeon H-GB2-1]|nr:hypothetical protein [Haloarculaceae archaeon H-GB1-1]MEA5388627.1 hypothetical protein [Haloarculaceae archaeon H-GB11]MEA5406682.1 hypothetical protein [Haloarculaceae archaeon H-GB2-1]
MAEDASLGDFASEPSEDESDDETAERGDEPASVTVSTDDVEPATATYRVAATPEPCAECATETTRLWRDGERFVCGDCKDW